MKTVTYDETKYVLVPVEPTEDMTAKGHSAGCDYATMNFAEAGFSGGVEEIWAAMLSAAPKPQEPASIQEQHDRIMGKS